MSTLNKIRKCQTLKGKTCSFCSWAERAENKLVRFSTAVYQLPTIFLTYPSRSYNHVPRFVCTAILDLHNALLFSFPPATDAEWPESCTLP